MKTKYTPEPWSQGRLLLTTKTRQWSSEQRERADAIEKKMVFVNFSEQDAGKLRRRVAFCETEEDAARIVACVNAMVGIEDPERFRKQRDELLAALKKIIDNVTMRSVHWEVTDILEELIEKIESGK